MAKHTPDFSLEVAGVAGVCPAGEAYAAQTKIPIFLCEGSCIRGEIGHPQSW
jgi:hypothetical protein